jgi:lipoyl synthase
MRLSIGSAAKLGFIDIKQLTPPTTCYVMLGKKCQNNCSFCSQNNEEHKLSRINWPEFNEKEIINQINSSDFQRVCLQCTSVEINVLNLIISKINKPISISYNFNHINQIKLIHKKVDNICIPFDVANKDKFYEIKHENYDNKLKIITQAAKLFPNKISTHLIVGLGETESEIVKLIKYFYSIGVDVGLFAFTPIKGTKLENVEQPKIGYYRRIQAKHYKIKHNTNKLSPVAFMTSGCEECNRPYYNESPKGPIYNYPRKLTDEEYENCKNETIQIKDLQA